MNPSAEKQKVTIEDLDRLTSDLFWENMKTQISVASNTNSSDIDVISVPLSHETGDFMLEFPSFVRIESVKVLFEGEGSNESIPYGVLRCLEKVTQFSLHHIIVSNNRFKVPYINQSRIDTKYARVWWIMQYSRL